MNNPELSSTHEIEIKNSIDDITDRIYLLYVKYVDNISAEDFKSQYINVKPSTPNHFENIITRNFPNERAAQISMTLLVMQLIDIAVNKSLPNKDYAEAWTYISKAEYWSGCIFALCSITKDIDGSILINKTETARKGGQTKAQNQHGTLKTEVCELFTEQRDKPWHSCSFAAKTIYAKIKEKNPSLATLSDEQATTTVSGWIKKIPNYEQYIKSKNKKTSLR